MNTAPNIFYCPFVFFHLGYLGIYVDKMDPNFKKKQKCPVRDAEDYFTWFC